MAFINPNCLTLGKKLFNIAEFQLKQQNRDMRYILNRNKYINTTDISDVSSVSQITDNMKILLIQNRTHKNRSPVLNKDKHTKTGFSNRFFVKNCSSYFHLFHIQKHQMVVFA